MKQLVAILLLYSFFVLPTAQAQWWEAPVPVDDQPLITVRGEAVVNVPADRCVLVLGIEIQDRSLAEARKESSNRAKQLTKAVKNFGIKEDKIQTEMFFVNPYSWSSEIKNYTVRQTFKIVTTRIDKVDELIALSLESGANAVLNVEFQTSELRKYRDQARELAIKAAKEKANAMASELGVSELVPYSLREIPTASQSWYGWWGSWWGGSRTAQSQNVVSNVSSAASKGSGSEDGIPSGKIAISGKVIASFKYRSAGKE